MIRVTCRVEDFTTQEPIDGCTLETRIVVAPRLFGSLPDLSLAEVLTDTTVTPADGRVALEFDAANAFARVEQLVRDGQASGTPVAYVEFAARSDGFELRRAIPRSLAIDDAVDAVLALDFAKCLIGHTTPTTTTLWFCLHKPEAPGEEYSCELREAASDAGSAPLQRHRVRFVARDANTAVVRIEGLEPATHYRYLLRQTRTPPGTDGRTERVLTGGELVTFSDEADAARLAIAFSSCHSPVHHSALSEGQEAASRKSLERWDSLARLPRSRYDMLLLMGDQIYADGIEKNFPRDPEWFTRFAKRYHQQWEYREVRRVLSSRPTYMILDDHEVRDDFGTVEEFADTNEEETAEIIAEGLRAYRAFQHSHNPGGADGPLHYHFRRGPAAFYVLDTRTRRKPHPENEDFPVLGRAQVDDFRAWAADSDEARTADVIVLVSSVPPAWFPIEVARQVVEDLSKSAGAVIGFLAHFGNPVAGAIGYGLGDVLDPVVFSVKLENKKDVEDQWTFGPNQADLRRVLTILFDLANDLDPRTGEPRPARRKRAVFVLGGDVHMGGAHVIRAAHDGTGGRRDYRDNRAIFALTGSPISHPPEDDRIYREAIEHASDDIDPGIVFVARALDWEVSDDSLRDVLGEEPASFVLDTEGDRLFRADLLGSTPARNYGLLSMRRIDAPGRQYEFAFSIEGQDESVARTRFTMNLDARRVVPIPTTPGLIAIPTGVTFGSVPVGGEARQTVSIRNVSGDRATVSIEGTASNALFRWAGFEGSLRHGEDHEVDIVFSPTSTRVEQAFLVVTSDVLASPLAVALTGKALGGFPEPPEEPPLPRRLIVEPTVLSFGSVPLNTVRTLRFSIQNGTAARVQVSIAAPPAGSPFEWEAFEGPIAGGATRRVDVRFRPRTAAIARGRIVVVSNAAGSPHSVSLLGKGPGGL
jgi:hypothetical protein